MFTWFSEHSLAVFFVQTILSADLFSERFILFFKRNQILWKFFENLEIFKLQHHQKISKFFRTAIFKNPTWNSFWRMIPYCKFSFVHIPRFGKMAFVYTPARRWPENQNWCSLQIGKLDLIEKQSCYNP